MPCFVADYSALHTTYEVLIAAYPGWRLADVRSMTPTERQFYIDSAYWRASSA